MRKFALLLLLLLAVSCKHAEVPKPDRADTNVRVFWGIQAPDVDRPAWTCVAISDTGMWVTYQEKYGLKITTPCIGLWESSTQYRITWRSGNCLLLEKQNVVSISHSRELPGS